MEIIVNLKTYLQGPQTYRLAKKIEELGLENKIILAAQPTEVGMLTEFTKLRPYSQHVDFWERGRNTGYIIPESLKVAEARGSLLNHSEHKISLEEIKKTIKRCNKLKLKLVVCASSLSEVKKIKSLKPYAIAFEDPSLIATGRSITKHNPKEIKQFVKLLDKTKIKPICGAGISSASDAEEAKKLGCKGVLIASAIAKSKNPEKLLKELGEVR